MLTAIFALAIIFIFSIFDFKKQTVPGLLVLPFLGIAIIILLLQGEFSFGYILFCLGLFFVFLIGGLALADILILFALPAFFKWNFISESIFISAGLILGLFAANKAFKREYKKIYFLPFLFLAMVFLYTKEILFGGA